MNDFNSKVGQRINQQQRDEMIAAYKSRFPNATQGNHFGVECFVELLNLTGAACIVTTFGCDADGNIKCIHAACDTDGKYLRDGNGEIISFEVGGVCPPICPQ